MTLYTPVYNYGRKCETIEHAEQLRIRWKGRVCRYIENVGFIGPVYYADSLFLSPESVWKYWNKEPISTGERWIVTE